MRYRLSRCICSMVRPLRNPLILLSSGILLLALQAQGAGLCRYGTVPCGSGCTPPMGVCVDNQCFTKTLKQTTCSPPTIECNGLACSMDEYCSDGQCQPDTCESRRARSDCSSDDTPLLGQDCRNSTFTACYASSHFICNKGPNGTLTECNSMAQRAAAAKSSASDHLVRPLWVSHATSTQADALPIAAGPCRLCKLTSLQSLGPILLIIKPYGHSSVSACRWGSCWHAR